MLFFFGLVNAGVTFGNVGAGTWFVLIAILIGKPVGILAPPQSPRLQAFVCPRASRGVT